MTRAVPVRLWALLLLLLLLLACAALLVWALLERSRFESERGDLLAQRYLLECVQAIELSRDNVTEKVAPLEGKGCDDPLLTRTGLTRPMSVASSEIRVNRALEPYSKGEYTVTVRSSGVRGWTLERGGRMVNTDSP